MKTKAPNPCTCGGSWETGELGIFGGWMYQVYCKCGKKGPNLPIKSAAVKGWDLQMEKEAAP